MRRIKLAFGSLTACAVLLAAGPSALAQQAQPNEGQNSDQVKNSDQAEKRGQAGKQSQGRNRDRQNAKKEGTAAKQTEAVSHFLAGYYAGYTDGWIDGSDEIVIGLVRQQSDRSRQMAEKGQSPDRMQPGRRAARDEMRGRMQGDMKSNAKSPSRDVSAVSLSGEIVAMKTVPIRNTDIEHRVVRLKTEEGRSRIVDLGPSNQTAKLNMTTGDTIEVHGKPVMAGDMRILAAVQVTSGEQTVEVHYKKLNLRDGGKNSERSQAGRKKEG